MRSALIIANTEYTDPGLAQLTAPGKDAEDFARVLKDQDICSFDDVNTLFNEPEYIVREAIDDFFNQKKPDDLLVLYFSGHGIRDEFGALYLAVKNTTRSKLRATGIKSDYIREVMDQSRSRRQVLILDCCNSGAFAHGTKAATGVSIGIATAFEAGYGRIILTASDSTQFAWEGDTVIGETDNSLFTHYLVKGLEGEADLDGDGSITVDELYDYAYENVKIATPKQTPSKFSSKQQGEIVLRRRMRPENIKSVPLPDELVDEIEDTRTYVREVAVQKLEKILKGKNIGLARSAREALEKIAAEDDSRKVSQAATQVITSIRQIEQRTEEERRVREEAERLETLRAEEERLVREKTQAERKAKEETEKLLRAQAAREAAEQEAARLKAEREEVERAAREAADRVLKEKADKEAAEREALEAAAPKEIEEETKQKVVSRDRKAAKPKWLLYGAIGTVIIAIGVCGYGTTSLLSKMFGGFSAAPTLTTISAPLVELATRAPTIPPTEASTLVPTAIGAGTGRIAFSSYRDDPKPTSCTACNDEIYVMNVDGSEQTRLTTNNAAADFRPVWSPDGKRIAFSSTRDETNLTTCTNCNYEIYVMNADGSGQTRLTNNAAVDSRPAWSPDGRQIVFQSIRDDPKPTSCTACNSEIYVMNTDGSGQTRLTNNAAADFRPVWSPDGKRIAFSSTRDETNPATCTNCNIEIYVMNADGSGQTRLTNNAAGDFDPAWSPDGKRIAFSSSRDDPNPTSCTNCSDEIYAMNTDGSGQTRLTNNRAGDYYPAWSPDSKHIAFVSTRDDPNPLTCTNCNTEIYVMNADGAEQTRLTKNLAGDFDPTWQPVESE